MKDIERLFESVAPKLEALAKSNAVVGRVVTVDGRHAVPLVELSLSVGGGGSGTGDDVSAGARDRGLGGGAGGGAKATPVAVVVVEGDRVRVTPLGH
jgi:uncharacterized spore protein YtfJ